MTGAWDWPTLIAGLGGGLIGGSLTVLAGWIAYRGARNAAEQQIAALKDERGETDRRRLVVVKMAVRAEGWRLDKEESRVGLAIKAKQEFTEKLLIESSPLLRGEREDAALLGDTLTTLEKAAIDLNSYNQRINTHWTYTDRDQLRKDCLRVLERLAGFAEKFKKER